MALITINDLTDIYLQGTAVNDDYWTGLMNDAIARVTKILNRAIESAEYTETGYTNENGIFYVKEIPITAESVTLTLNDAVITEDTDYTVDYTTGRIDCESNGEYSITYTGGYATVPATIKIAIAMLAVFRHNQLGQGIAQTESVGGQSLTYRTEEELIRQIASMLKPYTNETLGWINKEEYLEQT